MVLPRSHALFKREQLPLANESPNLEEELKLCERLAITLLDGAQSIMHWQGRTRRRKVTAFSILHLIVPSIKESVQKKRVGPAAWASGPH